MVENYPENKRSCLNLICLFCTYIWKLPTEDDMDLSQTANKGFWRNVRIFRVFFMYNPRFLGEIVLFFEIIIVLDIQQVTF